MTATQFAKSQLDSAGYMLDKVYEHMDEATLDLRVTPNAMTARETAEHLAECYECAIKVAAGQKHEWGSYHAADKTWPALGNQMKNLRAAAVASCLTGSDEGLKSASDYIISHDNYHVGQLCTIRLAADGSWDPYCIYQM